ncbi:MAG: hypothetical protein AAF399_17480 [Bacteroidota bacterium]
MIRLPQILLIALFVLGLVPPQESFAQDEKATQTELEAFLDNFAKDYANLPKSKNIQSLLKYFDEKAKSNIFSFGISGQSRVSNSDIPGFESYLKSIIRASEINLTYDIQDIYHTYTTSTFASLSYSLNYETKETNGIWVKGVETVMMALEKSNDQWKIVHYSIIQVEDEKLKGTCLCEIFLTEEADGEVVTKTTIPDGRSYSKKFNNFEFKTIEGEWLIRAGDDSFKRRANGEMVMLNGEEETKLGIANSRREAVLIILKERIYADSCARLQTKK